MVYETNVNPMPPSRPLPSQVCRRRRAAGRGAAAPAAPLGVVERGEVPDVARAAAVLRPVVVQQVVVGGGGARLDPGGAGAVLARGTVRCGGGGLRLPVHLQVRTVAAIDGDLGEKRKGTGVGCKLPTIKMGMNGCKEPLFI